MAVITMIIVGKMCSINFIGIKNILQYILITKNKRRTGGHRPVITQWPVLSGFNGTYTYRSKTRYAIYMYEYVHVIPFTSGSNSQFIGKRKKANYKRKFWTLNVFYVVKYATFFFNIELFVLDLKCLLSFT